MHLKLKRTAFLKELALMAGVVERRTTIPILANVLLEAAGDRLQLIGTDLDMTITTSVAAEIRREGRITLQLKVLLDLVRNLPEEDLELELDGDKVAIRCARFRSQIPSMDPAEFPSLPEIPETASYSLDLGLLRTMLDRVAFAITRDDPKFQLNGALVTLRPGEIEIAATDGHRLAIVRAAGPEAEPPFERQLFPRKLMSELSRLDEDQPVQITAGSSHLGFRAGSRVIASRMVESKFPPYEKVVRRDQPWSARLERADLIGALKRVSLLASEKSRGVRLALDGAGEMTLRSTGHDLGEAEETMQVAYQGDALELRLNASYLLDGLAVLNCAQIDLKIRDSSSQALMVPVGDDDRLEEYLYVLMPMRR